MQDVSDDVAAGVSGRLVPGQLEAAGAEGGDLQACGRLWKVRPRAEGEAGAGLVGAGAVLCDALVDGLVLWADVGDGQSPAGGGTLSGGWMKSSPSSSSLLRLLRVSVCELHVPARRQQLPVLQPDEVGLRDAGRRAAEDGAAPCWPGGRLRPLQELWRS